MQYVVLKIRSTEQEKEDHSLYTKRMLTLQYNSQKLNGAYKLEYCTGKHIAF